MVQPGECEGLKAAVHAGLGLCALTCLAYNVAAFLMRREPHLAANIVVYGLVTTYEAYQVQQHCLRGIDV